MDTFTQFLNDPQQLAAATQQARETLRKSNNQADLADNGARVIGERVTKSPLQHLEFGPYWWAVKEVLRARWADFGPETNGRLAAAYRGADDAETLVAAEAFKDLYRKTWAFGSSVFDLTGDGETVDVSDPDMLARVGRG